MAPKPAVDKLPLAVRKNVRDEWEAKKPEIEERISKTLGETWTVTTNPNLLYANSDDEDYKARVGSVIMWYMTPFCDNLENFAKSYGDDGKSELNTLCFKHQLEFAPQDDTKFTYGGMHIKEGVLRLVFSEGNFAVNVDNVSRDFHEVLKTAAAASGTGSAFNIIARNSVREEYDPKIGEVQEAIGKLVRVPDIKLTPNFEQNAAALAKGGDEVRDDWDNCHGPATLSYFKGLQGQLEYAGFKNDDMLQEGFQESVSKNEIQVRVVDKLKEGYHEVIVEDGVLVIQTVPKYWWTNVDDVGSKILEIM